VTAQAFEDRSAGRIGKGLEERIGGGLHATHNPWVMGQSIARRLSMSQAGIGWRISRGLPPRSPGVTGRIDG